MEKQYYYRKHIRYAQKTVPIVLGTLIGLYIIVAAIFLIFTDVMENVEILIFLLAGAFLSFIFAIEGVFIWLFFRRFTKVNVTLTDDFIIYKNIKGKTRIAIDQILKLEFPSIKYTGGWIKIIYPGGNIRLTVVLERIGDFIKELKTNLDSKGKQNTYDAKAMFSFYKTAEFSDQSWDRIYEIFTKLVLGTILNLLVGILLGIVISFPLSMLWIVASFALPLFTYTIAEVIIATRIAKRSSEDRFEVAQRDRPFEKKVYRTAFTIYSLFYIFVSGILLVLAYL